MLNIKWKQIKLLGIKFAVVLAAFLVFQDKAFSYVEPFEGIEFAHIEVNGQRVDFPIGNLERKNEIYYLKKAINGDKEALDVFMGGQETKWFFIGTDFPLWLKCQGGKFEIVKP